MSDPTAQSLAFRPRARIIQILGDQLIGSPRLAIFELVKNAYDADATEVEVTLTGIDSSEPTITVEDDGEGMSLDTIKNIWLVPAHDHRERQRNERKRTKRHRLPLGEKGVGRFAIHKLGDKIELVTRATGQNECFVSIDFSTLISEQFLEDAQVSVFSREPEVFTGEETGTKLIISRLREKSWTRGEVRRLMRQITSISSPFADKEDKFEAVLKIPEHPDWISSIPDVNAILDRAPWHFTFKFENGHFEWKYRFRGVSGIKVEPRSKSVASEPLLIARERDLDEYGNDQGKKRLRAERLTADSKHAEGIGPISGTFYVFDRDKDVLSKLPDTALIESFLNENGGVRVYRDDMRVYNYGEQGDDWLGLDLRRVNTPTRNVSRNIVVGAIELSLEQSIALTEKTNREGFIENDAYRRLKELVLGALAVFETERKIDKDNIRSLTGKGSDIEKKRITKPLDELRAAAQKYHLSKELDPLIGKIERDYNDMKDTMLRAGLSGMGLAIVFHEVERGVRVLYESIKSGRKIEFVQTQAKELVHVLDGFSELLRKGERRDHSLKTLIRRARDINIVRFRSHNVRLMCPALEDNAPDINANFAFGLVLGALNNLIDNAIYWLRVRWPQNDIQPSPRVIYLDINAELSTGPSIVISDSGPGFQDDPERLTRPFFSRRPDGMGLGLYYANLVMELNSGQLTFPEADEIGIPEEVDGATIALTFGERDKN